MSRPTWEERTVLIRNSKAEPTETVPCFVTPSAPGLCVAALGPPRDGYSVTHVQSGLAVLTIFAKRKNAERALLLIAPLGNWDRDGREVQYDEALREAVRAVVPRVRDTLGMRVLQDFREFDTRSGEVRAGRWTL